MKYRGMVLLAAALLCAATPAAADDDAQSRAYFETGAKAYEKGDYPNAIRAFEQAYALTKRPGLVFSIAQSYKRQYAIDSNPANLRKALDYYRRFLAEDKNGKRRGDATQSIMEIEAIIGRLPAEAQAGTAQPVEMPQPTQISVTTQVDDATISVDGGPPQPLGPIEVKPGKRKVVLQAPGYFPEEREIPATDKQMTAIDVQLRPMPAKVTITGRVGSTVSIDGSPRGTLPLLGPLDVDAGERMITVSQNGFVSYSREYNLGRGKEIAVKADLSRTRQRIGSYVLFGTGVLIAGSGVLMAATVGGIQDAGVKVDDARKAKGTLDPKTGMYAPGITLKDFSDYQTLRTDQATLRTSSIVAFNLGAVTAALGFLLYYFDEPKPPAIKPKKDDANPPKKDSSPGMRDMMFAPMVGPGFGGAAFSAKF